jgi:EmrB/QacA subfamily drug resistance transporter
MAATSPADDKVDPKVIKTGLILVVGFIAVVFDTTIVSVALHTLATQLHTSVSTIQWVTTGYLLALGMAVPLSTWALRRFGGKRLWMFALALFLVGSIGSSLAWNVDSLIGWRVVQGAGGGLLFPVLTTLIMQAAGGKALGRTVTLIALPALLGPILGPLAGGAILTHLSWRFMFWVNVPFCVAGLLLAWRHLSDDAAPPVRPKFDLLGFALLAPGIAALILGLSNAGSATGFGHPDVIIPLAAGVALMVAFTLYALRKSEPLVQVRLFAKRPVASSSAVLFFSGFALYGAMLLLPLFYQETRGATPLGAGIMLIPQGIGALLCRGIVGRLTDKIGARPVAVFGFVLVAASTIPFCFADPKTNTWLLAFWLLLRGIGLGTVTIPVMAVAYLGLEKQEIAHASVVTRTAQQVGGSFGTAVLAVILESAVASHHGNLTAAFNIAFWWSVGFAGLAAVLSIWLPSRPRPASAPAPAASGAVQGAAGTGQPVR